MGTIRNLFLSPGPPSHILRNPPMQSQYGCASVSSGIFHGATLNQSCSVLQPAELVGLFEQHFPGSTCLSVLELTVNLGLHWSSQTPSAQHLALILVGR